MSMASCIKVAMNKAEDVRQELIAQGVFDPLFIPLKEGEFVFFAVKKAPKGMRIVKRDLMARERA